VAVRTFGARACSAAACLLCAAAVALSAYASHGVHGEAQRRLALAAAFAFAHGLAVLATASRSSTTAFAGRLLLLSATALFSGSLVAAVFLHSGTALAPVGGVLLMLGWGILAVEFLKSP
jgi:uncharacterized membrane protein YgdD (TMEM256/DUF423 family)